MKTYLPRKKYVNHPQKLETEISHSLTACLNPSGVVLALVLKWRCGGLVEVLALTNISQPRRGVANWKLVFAHTHFARVGIDFIQNKEIENGE